MAADIAIGAKIQFLETVVLVVTKILITLMTVYQQWFVLRIIVNLSVAQIMLMLQVQDQVNSRNCIYNN